MKRPYPIKRAATSGYVVPEHPWGARCVVNKHHGRVQWKYRADVFGKHLCAEDMERLSEWLRGAANWAYWKRDTETAKRNSQR